MPQNIFSAQIVNSSVDGLSTDTATMIDSQNPDDGPDSTSSERPFVVDAEGQPVLRLTAGYENDLDEIVATRDAWEPEPVSLWAQTPGHKPQAPGARVSGRLEALLRAPQQVGVHRNTLVSRCLLRVAINCVIDI